MASRFDEELSHALDAIRGRVMRDLKVAGPAQVLRYDATHQMVDVRPMLAEWFPSEGDDVEQVFAPVLTDIPVAFPGGGGYRITFPVAVGDTVLLVIADRSLDAWLDQGGRQAPNDLRRHNLSDAVAIPGLHDNRHAWTGAATDHMTLGKDGGPQIHLKSSTVELGSSATQSAVNGTALMAALDTLQAAVGAFATAVGGATPAVVSAAATLNTAITAFTSLTTRLSSTVKVTP